MKTIFRILVIGILAFPLIGCDLFQTPATTQNTVTIFPTFLGTYSTSARSVILQIDEEMPLAQLYYPTFGGPHLVGFQTGSYKLNTPYSVSILDSEVNVTITRDVDTDATVYTGVYEDGEGYFVLTLPTDGAFTYTQYIVYEVYQDPMTLEPGEENAPSFTFIYNTVTGTRTGANFSGDGRSVMYNLDTIWDEVAEEEYPVGSVSGFSIEVCGRSDRFGLKIIGDLVVQTITDDYPDVDYSSELIGIVEEYSETAALEGNDFVILYNMDGEWGEVYATVYDEETEEESTNPDFEVTWDLLLEGDL
jgi:hypothetical protein